MKDYASESPEFHDKISIVGTDDPDNGDYISLADRQNHDNTVFLKKNKNKIDDDTTGVKYKLGIDNGLIYIEEAEESE